MTDILQSIARQAFGMASKFISSGEGFCLTRPFIFGDDHQPNDETVLVALAQIYNVLVADIMIRLSQIKNEIEKDGRETVDLFELVNAPSMTRYGVMIYTK